MPRSALITGITGQDGSYLAELLLSKGYEVHGLVRRSSSFNTDRIEGIYQDPHESHRRLFLHYGDLTDGVNLVNLVREIQPDEVYNLGAMSHVKVSFEMPEYTASTDAVGTVRLLEAIRSANLDCRFYQASTSEMFGSTPPPQNETTTFHPRSPYGAAKLYSHWVTINYREAYGLFAVSGILFNHESPRRGETFVSRKITRAVGRIAQGLQQKLYLGNLDAKRDWGYAKDYVDAMWRMLQQPKPQDFVIATGETHTVRLFCELAFLRAGIPIEWRGEGLEEKGYDTRNGKVVIAIDPRYLRPTEVDVLLGDATKAREILGWTPTTTYEKLVELMVDNDMRIAADEADLRVARDRRHTVSS